MPDITAQFEYTVDLNQTTQQVKIPCPFVVGNKLAHKILCHVTRSGTAVTLTGATCSGTAVVAGMTVPLTGTVDGSDCYITLPQGAYIAAGHIYVIVNLNTTAEINTILYAVGTILPGDTDTVYDPTDVIPSLADLLAQISAMQSATTACTTATTACNTASAKVATMTAAASASGSPSVAVSTVDGHYHLAFGLTGNRFYHGNAITGTSTTPAVYATGISEAQVGDRYYYEGSDSTNIGNVYRCTLAGDASTALWRYSENIRGSAGSGSVSTVFGINPDGNGNVAADASNINMDDDASNPVTIKSEIETHEASTGHITAAERTAWNGKTSAATATADLTNTGWAEGTDCYTKSVSVTGVTASNTVIVAPDPDDFDAWAAAEMRCTAQAAGSLTFTCTEVPDDTVTANILILS